jgi:hypothetical protein
MALSGFKSEGATGYRVRLYGTTLAAWLGFDLTGKGLDDCPDAEFGRLVAEACDTVIAEGLPRWERFTWQHGEDRHSCGALLLPLGNDGAGIDTVMPAMISDASEAANCARRGGASWPNGATLTSRSLDVSPHH